MGYCITQRCNHFTILNAKRDDALDAVRQLANKKAGYYWVDNDDYAKAGTLNEALGAWRWEVDENDTGDIIDIEFAGEKLGDDRVLFNAIAPFVEAESYIEMEGEDGCMWRWSFDGKTCQEISPTITW